MSSKNNGAAGAAAVLVLLGAVYGGFAIWKKDPNPANWFKSSSTEVVTSEAAASSSYTNEAGADVSADNVKSNVVVSDIATVNMKLLKAAATTDTRTFTYSFTPANASGSIVCELSCKSQSDYPCDQYVIASANETTKTITLTCVKPFYKQLMLKVYLSDSPYTYAQITLDYQDKITNVTPTLKVTEGYPFAVSTEFTETGGSIAANKVISGYNVSFSPDFYNQVYTTLNDYVIATSKATNGKNTGDLVGDYLQIAHERLDKYGGPIIYDPKTYTQYGTQIAAAGEGGAAMTWMFDKVGGPYHDLGADGIKSYKYTDEGALNYLISNPYKIKEFLTDTLIRLDDYNADGTADFGAFMLAPAFSLMNCPYAYLAKIFNGENETFVVSETYEGKAYKASYALKVSQLSADTFTSSVSQIVF
jgi:hypothetical protein